MLSDATGKVAVYLDKYTFQCNVNQGLSVWFVLGWLGDWESTQPQMWLWRLCPQRHLAGWWDCVRHIFSFPDIPWLCFLLLRDSHYLDVSRRSNGLLMSPAACPATKGSAGHQAHPARPGLGGGPLCSVSQVWTSASCSVTTTPALPTEQVGPPSEKSPCSALVRERITYKPVHLLRWTLWTRTGFK